MLNIAAKVIGVPLMKIAGSEAAARTVKTVAKEGGEQINISVKDVFQRYGAARDAGMVTGGKLISPKALKGRMELFVLRMKAIGQLFKALLGKVSGGRIGGAKGADAAKAAGDKAKAQAEALQQQQAGVQGAQGTANPGTQGTN